MEKNNTVLVPESIKVTTRDGSFVFSLFMNITETHDFMEQLANMAIRQLLDRGSSSEVPPPQQQQQQQQQQALHDAADANGGGKDGKGKMTSSGRKHAKKVRFRARGFRFLHCFNGRNLFFFTNLFFW